MLLNERLLSLLSLVSGIRTSPSARKNFHDRRLISLVRHAGKRVPFYRNLFQQGNLDPSRFAGLDDLYKIPISSKPAMQKHESRELLMEGRYQERLFKRHTSGSTGRPLTIYNSLFEESLLSCIRALAFGQIGLRPYHKIARIKLILPSRHSPAWIRVLQASGFFQETPINCLLEPPEILRQLQVASPDVVSGFPGVLALVADGLQGKGLPGLKSLIVGGEPLSPSLRERIEEGFKTPVFDTYASHEFIQIAIQCPYSRNLHLCEESVIVEVLDHHDHPVKEGETGEIVLTGLHSFVMPFIRFRLGDRVRLGPTPCQCGANVRTLSRVEGRTADYLVVGKRRVHFFSVVVELQSCFDWVRQYQLHQDKNGTITLRVVPRRHPRYNELREARLNAAKVLGSRDTFRIQLVSHIPPSPSGKYIVCRSDLWRSQHDG